MTGIDEPNEAVRRLRVLLGLTQQEMAQRLAEMAWSVRGAHVGVNADMVSKWERGQKRPNAFYADLLRQMSASPWFARRAVAGVEGSGAPGTAVLDAIEVLDSLGPDADLLRGPLLDLMRHELSNTDGGRTPTPDPATLAFRPPPDAPPGPPVAGASSVPLDRLRAIAAAVQRAYPSAPPAALLRILAAHLRTTTALIGSSRDPSTDLWAHHAQVALLAARVCLFDLSDTAASRTFLTASADAAVEAGDNTILAAALGHQGLAASLEQRPESAQRHLRKAHRLAGTQPLLGSWLAATAASTTTTRAGPEPAIRQLICARRLLDTGAGAPPPNWFDFHDHARLAGQEGHAYLRAGLFGPAQDALLEAEAALPEHATKQRSLVLADRALASVRTRDLDTACQLAAEAARLLSVADYATTRSRLVVVRGELEPWNDHQGVKHLDQILTSQTALPR